MSEPPTRREARPQVTSRGGVADGGAISERTGDRDRPIAKQVGQGDPRDRFVVDWWLPPAGSDPARKSRQQQIRKTATPGHNGGEQPAGRQPPG